MADYADIYGKRIKELSEDPTLDSSYEGQVWYNSTTGLLRSLVKIKAWSSSGNMGTARYLIGSCGSQTGALGFGGYSGAYKNDTEEYSGYNWITGGNMNLARFNPGGAGSQTAALAFGGFVGGPPPSPTNATEEYNGSSWTTQNAMPTAVRNPAGSGTQTAGLSSGGSQTAPLGGKTGITQEYDGTNWTTSPGSMNVARENATGFGIQTATIVAGGNEPGVNNAEQYNGSTWTAISDLNSPVYSLASAANGTTSHGITFGGASPAGTGLTQTEEWDGTSWTISSASLAAGKWKLGGAGTASAGLKFAGGPPPSGNVATEEYNSNINAITKAAWASIANFPDSRAYSGGSGGTPTSTLVFGGYTGPGLGGFVSSGAEFDGSSWTATGDYSIDVVGVAGLGPVTAGLGAGGYRDTATNVNSSYEYDGSSWTTGNNSNVAGQGAKMAGIQTAASMGNRSGDTDGHEQYDGTNWTAAANTPDASGAGSMMAGTQTALLKYGGEASGERNKTELFDGSSWTSGSNMNLDRRQGSHGGTQTYAIAGGGDSNPGIFGNTELWDGTSWASSASMGTARFYQVGGTSVGSGGVTSNIAATGRTPGSNQSNNCEEFTGGTSVITASTLTSS